MKAKTGELTSSIIAAALSWVLFQICTYGAYLGFRNNGLFLMAVSLFASWIWFRVFVRNFNHIRGKINGFKK